MNQSRISTGVHGLDEIPNGGLIPRRAYLIRGGPGCGKTTLGLHFLAAGLARGEKTLCITLTEPESQIRQNAKQRGIDLSGVAFLDLTPTPDFFTQVETYDIFSPAEVERAPITQQITAAVEAVRPDRVLVDSMTQFRYLSADPFQYRKQVLSFVRFLIEHGATVLFTSESSPEAPDADLQFLADGVIELQREGDQRSLSILKFRGSGFRQGRHSMRLDEEGMKVFPRLTPEAYRREFVPEPI
ncbi:MAG: recombinase RecA, partial [Anaerolineae bacterium]|nr:recombinase RecA [Anaerolineae bacterium]